MMDQYMLQPCFIKDISVAVPNAKEDLTLGSFNSIMEECIDAVTREQDSIAAAVEAEEASLASDEAIRRLCTESQLTFIVPPTTPPFHLRFRVDVNGKKEPWQNPLTWNDGYFFSPRIKGPAGNRRMAPPVLLSPEWEKANIQGKWAWQDQVCRPQEGELRLYTLAGLLPSVETSGISGKLVGMAGQGLYGVRTVELQFARAEDLTWEEVDERDWDLFPQSISYRLPSVDVGTAALNLALNWCRCIGVQKLQEALVSELGRKNRKANLRMIHDFAQDTYEKLVPVWHSTVEPWIAQNPTLSFLIKDRRIEMTRRRVVDVLQFLSDRGFIQGIPPALMPLRPTLLSVRCSIQGAPASAVGEDWMEVQEGQELLLSADAAPTNATGSTLADLKIWWLVPQANEPGLDIEALIGNKVSGACHNMVSGSGGRVRSEHPKTTDLVAQSELCLRGRNRWGNPIVDAGTEFIVRVAVEEPRAHEDDYRDVRVRVVKAAPEVNSEIRRNSSMVSALSTRSRSNSNVNEEHIEVDAPFRRTAPRVWGLTKPGEEMAEAFAKQLNLRCGLAEAARAALAETLKCAPTEADIAEVIAAVGQDGTLEEKASRFRKWYEESVFGSSLMSEAWRQLCETLRQRRNTLLEETLEIPRERWGFEENQWGGVVPEIGLMQQHLSCLTKKRLASIWVERDRVREITDGDKDDEQIETKPDAAFVRQATPRPPLKLEDPEAVDESTLLAVGEAFCGGMLKQCLSRLLPLACFDEELRKEWVQQSVEKPLTHSLEEVVTYRLAEYYRHTLSEETATARSAAEAEKQAREKAATDWFEAFRKDGASVGSPPQEVSLTEALKVVTKTAIKQEVSHFMETQMVPLVQTQLRERIVPAALETLRSILFDFVRKRWMRLGFFAFTVGTVATAFVLGPWFAVYLMFKSRNLNRLPT